MGWSNWTARSLPNPAGVDAGGLYGTEAPISSARLPKESHVADSADLGGCPTSGGRESLAASGVEMKRLSIGELLSLAVKQKKYPGEYLRAKRVVVSVLIGACTFAVGSEPA